MQLQLLNSVALTRHSTAMNVAPYSRDWLNDTETRPPEATKPRDGLVRNNAVLGAAGSL